MIILRTMLLATACTAALLTMAAPEPDIGDLANRAARYQSGHDIEPLRQLEQLTAHAVTDPILRAQLEVGLLHLLSPEATYEARKFACEQLAVVGSQTAVPALAALLEDPDTVAMACFALSANPSPMADDALRNALHTARGMARLQIIQTLGHRQDREAVGLLAELSRDADVATAEAAIIALGKIADPPARNILDALRKEARPQLVHVIEEATLQSAEHLVVTGNRRAALRVYEDLLGSADAVHVRRGALEALFSLDRDGGEGRMLSILRGPDSALRPVAIAGIVELPGTRVSQRFGRELSGLEPHEQVLLLEALAARGDAAAFDVVRAEVANRNQNVRLVAITALGQMGDHAAVPLLVRALTAADSSTERLTIERALVALPGGEATDRALIDALGYVPSIVKPNVMSALAQRRSRLAVPALLEETGSRMPAVVRAAFQALGRLVTASDLPALLDRLDALQASAARADAETTIVRALLQVESVDQRWDALRQRLDQADDLDTQLSLLRLLPNAPHPSALATLEIAVQNPNPQVSDTALRALADWPDLGAWHPLAGIYRAGPSESHRVLALRGLVRLVRESGAQPDAELIGRYRQLFEGAKRDDDRKLILGALSGVPHPDALTLAVSQLEISGVRAEAEQAVRQIAESIKEQHPDAAQSALHRLEQ